MFDQDKELRQYRNNINFSLVQNKGDSLTEDLEKLSEQMEKFPDHQTFVDEFIISVKKEDVGQIEKKMMKLITKVKLILFNEINTISNLIKNLPQERCLWIASAGVRGDEKGKVDHVPDKSEFRKMFKDFYIPELKLPLR